VNNLPMSMIAVQMLQHDAFSQNIAARFTGGAIVGLAIGANLTPIGSLSTILVRISLRRAGLEIPLRAYVIPGVIVTALTLLVASVAFLYQ
jgi:arsenical pump membrane protein